MELYFRLELNLFGIILSLLVIWLFYHQIKERTANNRLFLSIVYMVLIELILDSIFWSVDCRTFPFGTQINMLVNTLYYFFQMLVCYVWLVYCSAQIDEKVSKVRNYILSPVLVVGLLLIVVNLWTGGIFTVNEANEYSRTWGLWGTMEAGCCMFYPCYCVIMVIYYMAIGDKKKRQKGYYLLLVSLVPIISSIMQMLYYGLNFIWVGMALASLLILIEIEVKQYQRIQRELAEQKVQIMISQIQPHFLYNSLAAIQTLCEEDPKKAEEALGDFSLFLRGNMDSLKSTAPIHFTIEMNHIMHYVSLEKLRLEDRLQFVTDNEIEDFFVPPLTIQPIVENAVKHGIAKKRGGGTVKISTREMENQIILTIEDDGAGFDEQEVQEKNAHDKVTHIGIANVRGRIEKVMKGTMEIKSAKGKGTTVKVIIPKEWDSEYTSNR